MTLYPDWIPPKYPDWIKRLKGPDKRAFQTGYAFTGRTVEQAYKDGLEQLTPVIVATRKSPHELRKMVGKATWRLIHKGTLATNVKRAQIWLRAGLVTFDHCGWAEVVKIRPCHLDYVLREAKRHVYWEQLVFAGEKAEPHHFSQLAVLHRDCKRMGVVINPNWSAKRLKREHDAAALRVALKRMEEAIEKASEDTYGPPFSWEVDGYRFERLNNQRMLAEESFAMRHCIADYHNEAKNLGWVIFKIVGKERATFAFRTNEGICIFEEVQGFNNEVVISEELKAACLRCMRAYTLDQMPPKRRR